jgi:signal transduction histidine kinase
MRDRTTIYLIIASGLAMAVLILFQVSWMQHSQEMLAAQFNEKVEVALGRAVNELATNEECVKPFRQECNLTPAECTKELEAFIETEDFDQALSRSLAGFNIDMPYRADICSKPEASAKPIAYSLDPLTASDEHFVNLEFEGQTGYVLNQLGWMTGASFSILLFLGIVFAYATYHLLRQQRLSELNREFFNHMAHEFRTPLTNIRLAGTLLERKAGLDREQPHLKIIRSESAQLMQQVEQVLHLARLEKRDYLLQDESCELVGLVQESLTAMRLQIDEKGAEVHFSPTHVQMPFRGDVLQLRNVVRNLVDNALKYSGSPAHIRIDLQEQRQQYVLAVTDNGPGFTAEQKALVFEPYHRCRAVDGGRKGFGLGLAYVKRIVELHGGRVQLHSQPGEGARFECIFPKTP